MNLEYFYIRIKHKKMIKFFTYKKYTYYSIMIGVIKK